MSIYQTTGNGVSAGRDFVMFRGRAPRANRLAIGVSVALLSQACWPLAASAAPQGWAVTNCDDSGMGSLRDIVQNQAHSGDIVDLSQLPTLCGMSPSTITLSSAEIVVAQDNLTLQGPLDGTVKTSGGGAKRVLHHTGAGTLYVASLTIADGYYHIAGNAYGGCIESDSGNVYLNQVLVDNCFVLSDSGFANGGGVSSKSGNVTLGLSTISGNQANAPGQSGWGGGIYSGGTTTAKYSTIAGNAEHDAPGYHGHGGGIAARGITLSGSAIIGNSATYGSAIISSNGAVAIANSTISGNIASAVAAVSIGYHLSATISNTTIAFNHGELANDGAVYFAGPPSSKLTLQSSIIANNTTGPANTESDVYIFAGAGMLDPMGADNLVIASNIAAPPPGVITVTTDPMLGPLQLNGGFTPTHMLSPGSPALTKGNNNAQRPHDQRGLGYPRTTGTTVDIGAVQFDTIFVSGFDF